MKTLRLLAAMTAAAMLLVACGGQDTSGAPPGVENFGKTQSPPAQGMGSEGVPEILDFSAPRLEGGEVNGADYSGDDVALWFWAPW